MRISDWSSDVCSSDLLIESIEPYAQLLDQAHGGDHYAKALAIQAEKVHDSSKTPSARLLQALRDQNLRLHDYSLKRITEPPDALPATPLAPANIGRPSCRERVCQTLSNTGRAE